MVLLKWEQAINHVGSAGGPLLLNSHNKNGISAILKYFGYWNKQSIDFVLSISCNKWAIIQKLLF